MGQLLRLPLFWWPWQFWTVVNSSSGACLTFFARLHRIMCHWGEDTIRQKITVDVGPDLPAEAVSNVFHYEVSPTVHVVWPFKVFFSVRCLKTYSRVNVPLSRDLERLCTASRRLGFLLSPAGAQTADLTCGRGPMYPAPPDRPHLSHVAPPRRA